MTVLLGYRTALEYWRSCASLKNPDFVKKILGTTRARARATQQAYSALQKTDIPLIAKLLEHCTSDLDLDFVVGPTCSRNVRSGTRFHACSTLPLNSCIRADSRILRLLLHKNNRMFFDATERSAEFNDVYVGVPEFVFVQMARSSSIEEVIKLGFEICGIYSKPLDIDTQYNVPLLTNTQQLKDFLRRAKGTYGSKKANRALRYVLDNSASPMETALAMCLCLPYSLGGYGLPAPQMNYRIEIPVSLRDKIEESHFRCDLYWREHALAAEYDSDLCHAGIYKTSKDAMRRTWLEAMNISVLSVTHPQIMNTQAMHGLAISVARLMGRRLRCPAESFTNLHFYLRRQVL